MVRINYNQKETKRRPGCFNYFSHIIWFCGGKPYAAKKRKMKSDLNYTERKCRGFFTQGPSILHSCRQGWWLTPNPCCTLPVDTELRCSHAESKHGYDFKRGVEIPWPQSAKKKKSEPFLFCKSVFIACTSQWASKLNSYFSVVLLKSSSSKISFNNVVLIICYAILPSSWECALCLATGESLDEAWVRCSMNLHHSRPLFAESLLTRWCCHSAKLHSCSTICGGVNYPNVSGSSSVPH